MEPIRIKAFRNKYKQGNEKAPDFRGKYNGMEVAVWKEKDNDGDVCLSISVKDALARGEARKSAPRDEPSPYPDMSDDLPF